MHPESCAELLARAEGHLAPELAGAAARDRLRAVAGGIPAAHASSLWLECRLARGAPRVDLALRVAPAALTEVAEGEHDPLWAGIGRLARRMARGQGAAGRAGTGLWLEHDIHEVPGRRVPGVFLQLGAGGDPAGAVLEAAGELLGTPPAGPLACRLGRVLAAAPPWAGLGQVGVMLPRGESSVRLCFIFHDPARLPGLLARFGWPGSAAEVAASPGLAGFAGPMMLHLDVGPGGVLPVLGLDFRLEPRPQLRGGLRDRALLNALAGAGLADPGKAAALLRWPGAHRARPGELQSRWVSHLKLSFRPHSPPEAKSYLAFSLAALPSRRAAPTRIGGHRRDHPINGRPAPGDAPQTRQGQA
ncbi:MAG TPA: hypothetical protein VF710_26240 [Longimicrobium sp.]